MEVFARIAAADPKNSEAQHDLAFAWGERCIALLTLDRRADAEAACLEAIAIRERLIEADPSNQEDRRDLARIGRVLDDVRKR
jgi:hypothetical protein